MKATEVMQQHVAEQVSPNMDERLVHIDTSYNKYSNVQSTIVSVNNISKFYVSVNTISLGTRATTITPKIYAQLLYTPHSLAKINKFILMGLS